MPRADRGAEMLRFAGQLELHLLAPGVRRGRNRGAELFSGHRRRLQRRGGARGMSMTKRFLGSWLVPLGVAAATAATAACAREDVAAPAASPPPAASAPAPAPALT